MSLFYQQNRVATSCDFGGNAKLNSSLTTDVTAAAESCIANPSATFVPSGLPSTASGAKPTGTGKNGGGSVSLMDSIQSFGLVMGVSAVGALWTLLA